MKHHTRACRSRIYGNWFFDFRISVARNTAGFHFLCRLVRYIYRSELSITARAAAAAAAAHFLLDIIVFDEFPSSFARDDEVTGKPAIYCRSWILRDVFFFLELTMIFRAVKHFWRCVGWVGEFIMEFLFGKEFCGTWELLRRRAHAGCVSVKWSFW